MALKRASRPNWSVAIRLQKHLRRHRITSSQSRDVFLLLNSISFFLFIYIFPLSTIQYKNSLGLTQCTETSIIYNCSRSYKNPQIHTSHGLYGTNKKVGGGVGSILWRGSRASPVSCSKGEWNGEDCSLGSGVCVCVWGGLVVVQEQRPSHMICSWVLG